MLDSTRSSFLWEASNTPESPATDSSDTAAETPDLVLLETVVFLSSVVVSEMGERGALWLLWSLPTDS